MFEFIYSRATAKKILDDIKSFIFVLTIFIQALYISFLTYAIIAGSGNLIANIILAVISLAYLVFYVLKEKKIIKLKTKGNRKVKHAYGISKLAVKAFTLGVTFYGIFIAASDTSTVSIIFAASTLIGWIFGVIAELAKFIFEKYFDMLMVALKKDAQPIVNILNKIPKVNISLGEDDHDSKASIYVDSLGGELKKEIDEKKEAKKAAEREAKAQRRAELFGKIKGIFGKKASSKDESEEEKDYANK